MIFLERVERILKWVAKGQMPSEQIAFEAGQAELAARQEEATLGLMHQRRQTPAKRRQGMPAEQNHPLGPTEELLAKAQAEAMAQSQQPAMDNQVEADTQTAPLFEHTTAGMTNAQEQQPEQQEPFSLLQAPQDEGTRSHPTPETSPVAPGKEQHQQAVAEEMGEPGGGTQRTISTKTTLGAVVTLDGVYTVPRYQTVIKETPLTEKDEGSKQRVSVLKDLAKEQGRRELRQEPDQNRDRDKDRSMER